MTEKEKFNNYLIEQIRNNGLIEVHFYFNPRCPTNITDEEIYAELNRMIEAEDLPDRDVLGKYSL